MASKFTSAHECRFVAVLVNPGARRTDEPRAKDEPAKHEVVSGGTGAIRRYQ
jgi:hypothetical protein